MKFALFYEIPVPRPWEPDSELIAYQNTLAEAVAGDKAGWDAFWTVEHHFLKEYSHCSNPEVLYGAIAALTERIRLGYGVRLMPKPYNHPVRTAESVAVLDLISNGRVDFGTGRSATRAELEGFGLDPAETPATCGGRQSSMSSAAGPTRSTSSPGKHWQMPKRRVQPKPIQQPHPPIWGATTSEDGTPPGGRAGSGSVLVRRRRLAGGGQEEGGHLPGRLRRLHRPSRVLRSQRDRHLHHGPLLAGPGQGHRARPGVLRVVPEDGGPAIASVTDWMAERQRVPRFRTPTQPT